MRFIRSNPSYIMPSNKEEKISFQRQFNVKLKMINLLLLDFDLTKAHIKIKSHKEKFSNHMNYKNDSDSEENLAANMNTLQIIRKKQKKAEIRRKELLLAK